MRIQELLAEIKEACAKNGLVSEFMCLHVSELKIEARADNSGEISDGDGAVAISATLTAYLR